MRKPLRLLTYNVKMLSGWASKNRSLDRFRARSICDAIIEASPLPDIVCLQEVFDEEMRHIFRRRLEDSFPHIVEKCDGGSWYRQDSGLFFASRLEGPLFGTGPHHFQAFNHRGPMLGSDFWAEKGIFAAVFPAEFSTGPGALVLAQTHLQSDARHWGQHQEVRARQLGEVRDFLGAIIQAQDWPSDRIAVLLTGDFNIPARDLKVRDRPSDEYQSLPSILGDLRDLYSERESDEGNTWNPRENNFIKHQSGHQQRLDYVLALDSVGRSSHQTPLSLSPIVCHGCSLFRPSVGPAEGRLDLSDHFGVLCEFEL